MAELIGKTLGQYQIVEEVDRGGMAVVYRAYQPSLHRYVAIKVLPPQLTLDTTFVQRFLREARAAAQLEHPNIVTIYDVGEQEGIYYIVMPELKGESLRRLIRREGKLPLARVVHIVSQIASALDYAHAHGFVHRDIKPGNIIVDGDDHATLTDFGIVKAAEGAQLTRSMMMIGTPEYMSPEQAKGERVGPATDVYSLGITTYEMLAGRVPFKADSAPALLHKQVYERPRPVGVYATDLPSGVAGVLSKALAKDPVQRFESTGEFAEALQDAAAGKPFHWEEAEASTVVYSQETRGEDLRKSGERISPVRTLTEAARQLEEAGNVEGALTTYRQALELARSDPALASLERKIALTVQDLAERQERAEETVPVPSPALPRTTAVEHAARTGSESQRRQFAIVLLVFVSLLIVSLVGALAAFGVILPRRSALLPSPTVGTTETATVRAFRELATIPAKVGRLPMTTPTPTVTPTATATTTPTFTPVPPTATDTPVPPTTTPTSRCRLAVARQFAAIWDWDKLGCALAKTEITWSAWEAFERGYMFWRSDIDRVYVLYSGASDNKTAGQWMKSSPDWVWQGDNPNGIGLSPPPGLHEPKRGFGWLWRTHLGGPNSKIGWALAEERGFCAEIQSFEHGFLLRGGTIRSCIDEKINEPRTTHPAFTYILLTVYGDGEWHLH